MSTANDLETGYQTYDGNVHVEYSEPVTVGTDGYQESTTRTVSMDFPVRVFMQSEYTAAMTVSNVNVFSNWKVCVCVCVCALLRCRIRRDLVSGGNQSIAGDLLFRALTV